MLTRGSNVEYVAYAADYKAKSKISISDKQLVSHNAQYALLRDKHTSVSTKQQQQQQQQHVDIPSNKKRKYIHPKQGKGASVIEIEYSPEYERKRLRTGNPPQPCHKRKGRSSKKRKRMYQQQQNQQNKDHQEPPTKIQKNTKYPSYNLPYPKINKEVADQLKKNKTAQYNNNGQTTYKPYQIRMREQNVKSSVVVNKEIGYPMLLTEWIVSNSNGLVDKSSIPSHVGIENHMIHSITYTKEMMLTDEEEDTFIKCKLLLKQSQKSQRAVF